MAKKVFPIHLDDREREILQRVAERDGISKAAIIRRAIRGMAIDVMAPRAVKDSPSSKVAAEALV